MKKGMITFLAILWTFSLANAQTVTLTFTGRDASSQHVQLHRVCVTNLTRGWQETIYWPDTTLSMQNSTGISENGLGEGFSLAQNVPNPFSGETEVIMVTDATGEVFLTVSDVTGKSVAVFSRMLEPGGHHFRIRLADAQTYILTARQGARSASVKMVNKGTSKGNEILYEGSGNPISYTLKSSTTHPFTFGDQMEYVGYAVINGSEEESQRITQAQDASQTFVMQFQGEQHRLPTVITSAVTDLAAIALYGSCAVDEFSAVCGGSVTEEGTTPVLERGVCWGTSHNPTIADNHTVDGNGIGVFNSSITGLVPGLTYYVRAYATNNTGTAYGTEESFVTTGSLPCVTNDYVSGPFSTCVEFDALVYDEGSSSVLERGVCWSTSPNPTIADNHISNGVGSGYFDCSISGLNPHTTYYMCAYAINNLGISYSEEEEIVTGGNPQPNLGAIHSSEVIDLTTIQVSVGDFHWHMCVDSIIDKGVCWDTTQFSDYSSYCDLTLADSHMSAGSGNAGFIINITNVMPNVWYCFSVYVITASGDTIYWHNVLQKRKIHIYLPSVTTLNNASNITDTSAISGGNVTWGGSNQFPEAVTSRGICWSTSHNPTIADSHTSDGSGTGSFTSSITGFAPGTTYYVRAYATNSIGTAYGNEVNFTTAVVTSLPVVTTDSATNITQASASLGGNVISDGGLPVTSRGVCWSTTHLPTIADNRIYVESGTGGFTRSITGLTPGTTYYVRAYAINSAGTTYGNEVSFTTDSLPIVTTRPVHDISGTFAFSGGNVSHSGCISCVTARGVCWSTSSNPTITDSHTSNDYGTGIYTSTLTGLTPSTTYYVRAYATNSVGTVYGHEISFTTDSLTLSCGTNILDYDENLYHTVQIGNQCWMKENMRVTHYADGTSIPNGTGMIILSNTAPYYYDYSFISNLNLEDRGYLYNWSAAMHGASSSNASPSGVQGICPVGWHLPSDAEWTQLTDYVSGQGQYWCNNDSINIARALSSSTGWMSSTHICAINKTNPLNIGPSSLTGFRAKPAGSWGRNSDLYSGNKSALFWSATGWVTGAYFRYLYYENPDIQRLECGSRYGLSVRCLRDEENYTTPTVNTNTIDVYSETTATCGGVVVSDGGAPITARGVCWSTFQNPTTNDNHTNDGRGWGNFTSNLTGLSDGTTYYVRAYASNAYGTSYGNEVSFTTPVICGMFTITDYDGNTYNTVQIGNQCWMKENMRATHYSDGTAIAQATVSQYSSSVPYYYNPGLTTDYGFLYNWSAMMHGTSSSFANPSGVQGVCPMGWHIPSDSEWTELTQYVGSQSQYRCGNNNTYIAKALASTSGWSYSSLSTCDVGYLQSGNNATGFSALPAGSYLHMGSTFFNSSDNAYFWSATENSSTHGINWYLAYLFPNINSNTCAKANAYSVRCLRD